MFTPSYHHPLYTHDPQHKENMDGTERAARLYDAIGVELGDARLLPLILHRGESKYENLIGVEGDARVLRGKGSRDSKMYKAHQEIAFLGDAVLFWLVTLRLFIESGSASPRARDTRRKMLISNNWLGKIAKQIGIDKLLIAPSDVLKNAQDVGRYKTLGDLMEAVIGAIFFDQGPEAAYDFVVRVVMQEGAHPSGMHRFACAPRAPVVMTDRIEALLNGTISSDDKSGGGQRPERRRRRGRRRPNPISKLKARCRRLWDDQPSINSTRGTDHRWTTTVMIQGTCRATHTCDDREASRRGAAKKALGTLPPERPSA